MMRSLGAAHVVDYTQEDYTKSSETYDLIIDVVGKLSVSRRLKLLKEDGIYFLAFAKPKHIFLGWWTSLTSKKRVKIQAADQTKEDLIALKELIESGVLKPVIDRIYPLEQLLDAHRYVEAGGKKGNVCITLEAEPDK
jgi:NADPH:quinone reductase-like Zn-dependent oxidoreductase